MSNQVASLNFPAAVRRRGLDLRDGHRDRGIHIVAGSGSGKSLWLGKVLSFLDFLRGVPQILFDPPVPL